MSSKSYDEILHRARHELDADERLKLVNELSQRPLARTPRHSILELKGLGKEIWEGVDPDSYVREERDAWNG
jgi:hypothetical protein